MSAFSCLLLACLLASASSRNSQTTATKGIRSAGKLGGKSAADGSKQGVATDVVVAKATGYRAPGADHNHTRPQITFYMYTEPELDHGWLESCGGFDLLRTSTASEKLAEVGLRRSLYSSPLRVNDPHEAVVFYVPGAALNSPAPAPARPLPLKASHPHRSPIKKSKLMCNVMSPGENHTRLTGKVHTHKTSLSLACDPSRHRCASCHRQPPRAA